MIDGKKVLGLIPARGGSKGLPGKNLIEVHGRPLVAWPIKAALDAEFVDTVILSTDSDEIAETGREHGAEVPFMRPDELAADSSSSQSVIEHAISWCSSHGQEFDYIVLLEPTSPLTTGKDVDKALLRLHARRDIADSIVGISRLEATHPRFNVFLDEQGLIVSSDDYGAGVRRQELDDVFFYEGSLYISDVPTLLKTNGFYHERTLGYVVPKWQAFEIDDIIDLVCVRAIFEHLDEVKHAAK